MKWPSNLYSYGNSTRGNIPIFEFGLGGFPHYRILDEAHVVYQIITIG